MINIQLIRNRPDEVRDAMRRRHEDAPLDRIIAMDAKLRRRHYRRSRRISCTTK